MGIKKIREKLLKLKLQQENKKQSGIKVIREKNLKLKLKKEKEEKQKQIKKLKQKEHNSSKRKEFSILKNKKKKEELDKRIIRINKKYDHKIKLINQKINKVSPLQIKQEKIKNQKSILMKFFNKRIDTIDKRLKRKINKIEYNVKIAKISEETGLEKIDSLKVSAGLEFERFDSKISKLKDLTSKKRYKNQVLKTNKIRNEELATVSIRKKRMSPSTNYDLIIDK